MTEELVCQTCQQTFRKVTESGITLDYCERCSLVWFDEFELEQYCRNQSISLLRDDQAFTDDPNSSCPKCNRNLATSTVASETGHQISACRHCRGYLVASELIDSQLPVRPRELPLQQLEGPISILELLSLFYPWSV